MAVGVVTSTLICNRWPLQIRPGAGGFYSYLHTASSKNAACFLHLVESLPSGLRVAEHFGGVGQMATIVQKVLCPVKHFIWDLDDDCVAQLQMAFDGVDGVRVEKGDAKSTMGSVEADLVVLDFPYATIKHAPDWPWVRVAQSRPRYIIWSDVALRRLGLHRAVYSRLFGTSIVSQRDYCEAYSRSMWDSYGYCVTHVAHHVYSYLLAEPLNAWVPPVITKVTQKGPTINEDLPRSNPAEVSVG